MCEPNNDQHTPTPQYARYDGRWYYCWLIERRDGDQPRWLGEYAWETDANKAIWYARKSDAEAICDHHKAGAEKWVVCEHGFDLGKSTVPPLDWPDDDPASVYLADPAALRVPRHACNAHEALVAALERAQHRVLWLMQFANDCDKTPIDAEIELWSAVIKSARGES